MLMEGFLRVSLEENGGENKPTLLLRRTIGLKKDEYQLDRKSTSKGEVMSILESAGFSRSNPYYIVPQGRITHLTNQKDQDRLHLLKEVAGTKLYEERRAESTKIMDETNTKREKIDDLLNFIKDRLDELEEEKEELKEFQTQDRKRRTLEYAIYQRELKDVGEALDTIEDDRRRDIDNANSRRSEYTQRESDMAAHDATMANCKQRLELLSIDHRQASSDRREATKAKAQIECLVSDAEESSKKGSDRIAEYTEDLAAVEAEILEKEAELMEATPAWEDEKKEEGELKDRLGEAETTLATLAAKMGRTEQFKTQKDRDQYIKETVKNRKGLVGQRERRLEELKKDLESTKRELEETGEKAGEQRKEMAGRKEELKRLNEELAEIREEEAEKIEQRKGLWKQDARLESQVKHARDECKNKERDLFTMMDRVRLVFPSTSLSTFADISTAQDTNKGLTSVKAIAERLNLEGYHGPLYDLFTVEERYKTAVEVTAGTSLFQVVVDTDETATKILDVMMKEKSGRVTFVPLNRLKHQDVEYPNAKEAIAMIKKLDFDKKYTLAFEQVFGKTIICQNLEIAGAYTRQHNLNSITLEGDKYDRKGSLTGGYHDSKRSRLDAIKALKTWQARFEDESAQLTEVRDTIFQLDQQITQLGGKKQVAEAKLRRVAEDREPMALALQSTEAEEDRLRGRIKKYEVAQQENMSAIRNLKTEIEAFEAELKTKMEQTLSDAELLLVDTLNAETDQLKKELVQCSKRVAELASRKTLLDLDLSENLRRRRDELNAKIDSYGVTGSQITHTQDLDARKKEVLTLTRTIEELSEKLEQIDQETEQLNAQVASLAKDREKMESQQADDGRSLAKQQKNVERYLTKKQMLVSRKDDCNKNIRDLGVLPEEAFVETNDSSEKLLKKLRKVNEALKGFAHVNKKAYEQYTSFTKQQDDLKERQAELEESSESILELIDALDARKDEAIERTFKQVAKYFEEVFEQLVPTGRGRLIMQRRELHKADDMDVDGDEDEDDGGVENYTGVAIRVSFQSKSNEGHKIQQLSGGQKALVALALIFAIQKCDPAPFYLFDEVDSALDSQIRERVAGGPFFRFASFCGPLLTFFFLSAMISELSQTGQYICTTFRPELIPHAESYFGVVCYFPGLLGNSEHLLTPDSLQVFNNSKISNVKSISADECLTFVEVRTAEGRWTRVDDLIWRTRTPTTQFIIDETYNSWEEEVPVRGTRASAGGDGSQRQWASGFAAVGGETRSRSADDFRRGQADYVYNSLHPGIAPFPTFERTRQFEGPTSDEDATSSPEDASPLFSGPSRHQYQPSSSYRQQHFSTFSSPSSTPPQSRAETLSRPYSEPSPPYGSHSSRQDSPSETLNSRPQLLGDATYHLFLQQGGAEGALSGGREAWQEAAEEGFNNRLRIEDTYVRDSGISEVLDRWRLSSAQGVAASPGERQFEGWRDTD
ncbi:structural maintenance of chromosome 3 (chondroitin sulfate proteoglycan 6), partial [Phenoliferia sp. Uapishka_3]